jgi:alpha-mannosidase
LIDVSGTGLEISSLTYEGGDLLVRLFNAEGDNGTKILSIDGKAVNVELVELSGLKVEDIKMSISKDARTTIKISVPRFGIRTIKFTGLLLSHLP